MRPIKRILIFILAAAAALSFSSCSLVGNTGRSACEAFLRCICEADYAGAYAMLSSSVTCPDGDDSDGRISEKAFADKYKNIFDALGITAVEYSNLVCTEGDLLIKAEYTSVYRSETTEDISDNFEIVAVREDGEWRIEWSPSLIFPELDWGGTVRVARIPACRGDIMADGQGLAVTDGAITVYASPSKIEDEALFTAQAARLLSMSEDDVKKALKKTYDDVAVLKVYYSDQFTDSLEAQLLSVPGIGVDDGNFNTVRYYPYGSLLAHTIGYVGSITAPTNEELDAKIDALNAAAGDENAYNYDSVVGLVGLESKYETELRGRDGTRIFIANADGVNLRTLYEQKAENGRDINLTVNLSLQQRVEEVMQYVLFGDTTAGAVVVLNPKTGAVQAMASYPTYDINLFARGISNADYSALLADPAKPLINRITQGRYPPGSVFKAMTAAIALDTGTLTTDFVFSEPIEEDYWTPLSFGQWMSTPIKRASMRGVRATPLNMHNAIITSDNIYFAYAALTLGWDKLLSRFSALGMEETVPFDLNVASSQLLNEGTDRTLAMLADTGYGQGEVLTTPLQLAATFSAFANGGDIPVPRLIEGFYAVNGIKYDTVSQSAYSAWKTDVVSESAISAIVPMLRDVTSRDYNGTGRELGVTSCTVAAKTGTAEIGNDKSREISWFCGFRTGVEPEDERLVLVMLEVPAQTKFSSLKFDIARELLKLDAP